MFPGEREPGAEAVVSAYTCGGTTARVGARELKANETNSSRELNVDLKWLLSKPICSPEEQGKEWEDGERSEQSNRPKR